MPINGVAMESTTKGDVWSFGVFLWELETGGRVPYEEQADVVDFVVRQGGRLVLPPHGASSLPEWRALVVGLTCWARSRFAPYTSSSDIE